MLRLSLTRRAPILLIVLFARVVLPALAQTPILVPDPNLEGAVRVSLNKLTGELTDTDMLSLSHLAASSRSITNLGGIQWAGNLTYLDLLHNYISDISPLTSLTNLQHIQLADNPITNFWPLSQHTQLGYLGLSKAGVSDLSWIVGLRGLHQLSLRDNQVQNITPLAGLTGLVALELEENAITNFMPLCSLTNALHFRLQWNMIRDLTFAQHLTNALSLLLDNNRITNIFVLQSLPALRTVWLVGNALDVSPGSTSLSVIQSLQSRGVTVNYEPQTEAPRINLESNWFIAMNQTDSLALELYDDTTVFDELSITIRSSNSNLLNDANIALTPPNNRWPWYAPPDSFGRYLTVTPSSNQTGTTTITLTATDDTQLTRVKTIKLHVATPQLLNGQILNSPDLSWQTVGNPAWFGQSSISRDGVGAAQTGSKGSWLQTTVSGPGTITFWRKSVNLNTNAFFPDGPVGQFTADCSSCGVKGGLTLNFVDQWQMETVRLAAGLWTLRWETISDAYLGSSLYLNATSNVYWLDQVSFVPGPAPGSLSISTFLPFHFSMYVFGELGSTYDIEATSDLKTWTPVTRLRLRSFVEPFWDENHPSHRFYRLRKVSP